MKNLLYLTIALSLSGCATTANYEKILNTWVGSSAESLVEAWGAPSNVVQVTDTKKAVVYEFNGGASTYGNVNQYGGYSGYTVANTCTTTFIVTEGQISSWQWRGNSCRANAPSTPHPPDDQKETLFEKIGINF